MIVSAEQVNQPLSGEFKERIYDIQNTWNSQNWTWIKFVNDDYSQWCGQFRGKYIGHAISSKFKSVLVLTSDYFYELSIINGDLQRYEDRPEYKNLTVSPSGDYIVSDYYRIYLINETIKDVTPIALPISVDMIEFKGWKGSKLTILADEFVNWDNHIQLELDCESMEFTIVSQSKANNI